MNRQIIALGFVCIVGAMTTSSLAGNSFGAMSVTMPDGKTASYSHGQGFSADLGSKRAVGYFVADKGRCQLTLMVAEPFDAEGTAKPTSAARLQLSLAARDAAELQSEEGRTLRMTCGADARAVSIETAGAPRG